MIEMLWQEDCYGYSNVVKEKNVPFGYIHGVNIENVTKQLYRELKELDA